MRNPDLLVLVALPRGAPYSGAVPGSAPFDCDRCRGGVMLAPSTRELMQKHTGRTRILCLPCALVESHERGERLVGHVAPGAIEELHAYMHRN